jgi:Fanconi anemia group M protein
MKCFHLFRSESLARKKLGKICCPANSTMSKKQTTLFQSWGNKGKSTIQPDHVTNPLPAVEPVDNDVIDLCGSFEDDDDDLLCEAEESVADIRNNSTKLVQNNLCNSSVSHDSKADDQNVCDISIGAEGFTPTQAQTQYSNLPGFDKCAGKLWIYPTNYLVREYQFNIVQQALFKNTMVTLPTGLGKTFIAAVVMYNFYRWYPQGKVIFMAPTKPLVAQQIEACYNIMGIPQDHTAEMTGKE